MQEYKIDTEYQGINNSIQNQPKVHAIQHIGIGVTDHAKAWSFYRDQLGFIVPVSKAHSEAARMGELTDGVQKRKVVIALNLLGGAMIEIFQFTSKSVRPRPKIQWGNTGILGFSLKVLDIHKAYIDLKKAGVEIITGPVDMLPAKNAGWKQMFFRDPDGNILSLIQSDDMKFSLRRRKANIGGIELTTIGVSDMDKSLNYYRNILGYSKIIYDWEGKDKNLKDIPGADRKLRRVLLTKPEGSTSMFRYFFKAGMIELIEVDEQNKVHTFKNRGWGDQGIFELCFDVNDIGGTFNNLVRNGARPVLEPNVEAFDMGEETSALFGYVNDPDGLFIEIVEIAGFRILPGVKFDLRKRGAHRPLSPFLMKLLRYARENKRVTVAIA